MHLKVLLLWISFLFFSYCAMSQGRPERVKIDEHLNAMFPDHVQRIDSLGVTLFQTAVQRITYQIVMKENIFQDGSNKDRNSLIEDAANIILNQPKFRNLAKMAKDSVVGGSSGKFIRMTGSNAAKPYRIFIFVTMRQRTMYSVQMTSFNTQEITDASAYYFFSHLEFHRPK